MDNTKKKAIDLLTSKEYLDNIEGLDQTIMHLDKITVLSMQALERAEEKSFIAERIFRLVDLLITTIEKEFSNSTNDDAKCQLALILYTRNIGNYESYLLEYISKYDDIERVYFPLMRLATRRVPAAKIIIEQWIDKLSDKVTEQSKKNINYLADLKELIGSFYSD